MKKITFILTVLILNLTVVFGQTNVALTKSITATGFNNYTDSPSRALDGSFSTNFVASGPTESYVTIDLGTPFPINWVKIFYGTNAPQIHQISSSLNDTTYTVLSTATAKNNALNEVAITSFPNNINKHRYIRVAFQSTTGSINITVGDIAVICNSCVTMAYTYDDQGNRISRSIILPPAGLKSAVAIYDSTTQALKNEFIPENIFSDAVGESKVSIYPNPTRGELVVQVTNPNTDAIHGIMLFDSNGAIVYQKENATEYTDVDITNKPAGLYILKILNGENSTTWKIIKQ